MTTLTSSLIVKLIEHVTAPARAVTAALDRMTAAQQRNAARLKAARAGMVEAAAVGYTLARSLAAPVRAAMELESAMADVAKVTNFDDKGLKGFERALREMAVSEIPLAVTELTALAAAAAQSGVPEKDLLDFTRMTAKAAVAWEVTGAEAGESLAKLRAALGMTNEEVGLFADAINHLSDNSASNAPDLVNFAKAVAAHGEFFGIAREQTLAFGAAMIGAGYEAEVSATSFRNMGKALTRGSSATKRQNAAFKALGLDAVRVAKRMQKDAVGTILDVIERLGKIPAHMQASIMSDLFGDEARALTPLLNRLDILREALGHVSDRSAYAGSVSREFAKRAETAEYALERFKSQVRELAIVIGSALLPAMNSVMAILGPVVLSVAELADQYPQLTAAIVGTVAAFVALRVAAIATQFAFLWLKGGLIASAIASLRGLSAAGRLAALAFLPFTSAVKGARMAMVGYAAAAAIAGHGSALKIMASGLMSALSPLRLVTGAFNLLKLALIGSGIGAALLAVAAAGTWIYNNWEGIGVAFEAFKGAFMRAIEPIMPALEPVIEGFNWVWDSVTSLLGPIDEMNGGWAEFGIAVGNAVGEAVVAIVTLPGKVIAMASEMLDAGMQIAQSLWDGIKAKIDEMIAWFSSLPQRIIAAIGSIDIGSLISWGGLPSLFGGGSSGGGEVEARASGGPVRGGGSYLVGERGPEVVTFSRSGFVNNAVQTARLARDAAIASAAALAAASAPAAAASSGGAMAGAGAGVRVDGITIQVQGAPGQSATEIAYEVERILSARLSGLANGAFSDGVV